MVFAIQHIITAGSQFTGALPATTPVTTNGVKTYPTAVAGGLFDFEAPTYPVEVREVMVKFGGQSAWLLAISDALGDIEVASGTTETSYFLPFDKRITLLPGQKLKLTTTGATLAMRAAVLFSPAMLGEA